MFFGNDYLELKDSSSFNKFLKIPQFNFFELNFNILLKHNK